MFSECTPRTGRLLANGDFTGTPYNSSLFQSVFRTACNGPIQNCAAGCSRQIYGRRAAWRDSPAIWPVSPPCCSRWRNCWARSSSLWGEHLGGWIGFLVFVASLLFFILAFRWVKRRILWRLRNRLIVTYVFIGVIPAVLLVAMAIITLYGLGGQFAIFVVTSEIHAQLRSLEAANSAVTNELAAHLERGEKPTAESLAGLRKRDPSWARRRFARGTERNCSSLEPNIRKRRPTIPDFVKGKFRDIVRDRGQLYLRVASTMPVGSDELTVVTSEPFDKELVGKIAADLGEITLYTNIVIVTYETAKPGDQAPIITPDLH